MVRFRTNRSTHDRELLDLTWKNQSNPQGTLDGLILEMGLLPRDPPSQGRRYSAGLSCHSSAGKDGQKRVLKSSRKPFTGRVTTLPRWYLSLDNKNHTPVSGDSDNRSLLVEKGTKTFRSIREQYIETTRTRWIFSIARELGLKTMAHI